MKTSVKKSPAPKPTGRHLVDGVLHYDGTGPSGYTGRCAQPKLRGSIMRDPSKLMIALAAEAAKRAERAKKRRATRKAKSSS